MNRRNFLKKALALGIATALPTVFSKEKEFTPTYIGCDFANEQDAARVSYFTHYRILNGKWVCILHSDLYTELK